MLSKAEGPPPFDSWHAPDPPDPAVRLERVMDDRDEYCKSRWPELFQEKKG